MEPKLIKTWAELAEVPASATHRLEIDVEDCNGWIVEINPTPNVSKLPGRYLSTHTFYGSSHAQSTAALQAAGFNVVIANWDEAVPAADVQVAPCPRLTKSHPMFTGAALAMAAMAGVGFGSYTAASSWAFSGAAPRARRYARGPCEVCGKPNVRSGRERGVYRCGEHQPTTTKPTYT